MKYDIVFHPEAQKEYLEACYWYDQNLIGLGNIFKFFVLDQIDLILTSPESYPVKRRNYRESNVHKFPYTIVYSIDSKEQIITVSAIYHTSRDPRKKYRK